MKSKLLVRSLIILLAVFFIFRIHQRIETYRVPQDECRNQLSTLSNANIELMYDESGILAISLDSLLRFAAEAGVFSAEVVNDKIIISIPGSGNVRTLQVPAEWENLWNETAVTSIQDRRSDIDAALAETELFIQNWEEESPFSMDSLISLREVYIAENPIIENDVDSLLSPAEVFDDSIGFNAVTLLAEKTSLQASSDSISAVLSQFNEVIIPARQDSVTRLAFAVCPSLWAEGFYDSVYSYDSKLALGSQFALSCPNHDRHGCVVGGLVEKEYPDSLFEEPDWSDMQTVYPFPAYALDRRIQVSRSNLLRAAEEEAAYLAQRYPQVLRPKDPEYLEMNIDDLVDPMGGEYVFEVVVDTVYSYFENPNGWSRYSRGDSVSVTAWKFVGYTDGDSTLSRVEVFFTHPLRFPSRTDGAIAGENDHVKIIKYWDRSELGTLQIEEREVDLLDVPVWDFLLGRFDIDTTGTDQ